MLELRPQPLTAAAFAPFGDVIASSADAAAMNDARFARFDDLCALEAQDGRFAISIAKCRVATALPYTFDQVERHPRGSQAFVPLRPCRMLLVVAAAAPTVSAQDLNAFISNGQQGINYHCGTWHMPLIAFDVDQEFLIVDRVGESPNCDVQQLEQAVTILNT